MTKTELKRQQTKAVIELLQNKFGATNFDDEGHGYFTFNVGEFTGHLERRDFSVMFFDSIKLHNPKNFPVETVERHKRAVTLEDEINKAITNLLK